MNLINRKNFLFIFDSISLNPNLKKLEFIYHFHYGKKKTQKKKQETRRPIYGDAHLDFATYRIALLRKNIHYEVALSMGLLSLWYSIKLMVAG